VLNENNNNKKVSCRVKRVAKRKEILSLTHSKKYYYKKLNLSGAENLTKSKE
jgi:hypothetical protein